METEQNVDRHTVEQAYKRAKEAQMRNSFGADRYSSLALNHARNRDPKILNVLEKAANIMNSIWEEQLGEYSRGSSVAHSHTKKPVEVQLWQEAYRTADEGIALANFKWIYFAAYELAYGRVNK